MRSSFTCFKSAVLAVACLGATPSISDDADSIVVTTNPAMVALKLRDMGYRAKLGTENDRPAIESGTSGILFSIVFYGCENQTNCTGLLFDTSFDLDRGISLEEINAWNSDRLLGRTFADDDCDPYLDHYVVADPVMSGAAFERLIDYWDDTLNDFVNHIGFDDDTPRATAVKCGAENEAI